MRITSFVIINIVAILSNIACVFLYRFGKNSKPEVKSEVVDVEAEVAKPEAKVVKAEAEATEVKTDVVNAEGTEDQVIEAADSHESEAEDALRVGSVFLVAMFVMNILLANVITYIYDNSVIINSKLIFLVSVLWPIAFIDSKTKKIPNNILKVMLAVRAVILIPELILLDGAGQRLLSMLISALAVLVACVLCCLIIKGAIGMGDVKLFIVMALYLGLDGIWSAIFCSLVVSFFVAIFSLITKRVTRKDNMAFAPAILIGTYLSVFLTGI
jgi:leader peptidase (prepilin peptidase)/N-methyltransferase